MTQEDKELLLKDLCARLPYGVKCQYTSIQPGCETYNAVGTLTSINNARTNLYKFEIDFRIVGFSDFKPYLRPMSSMTDEEIETYRIIIKSLLENSITDNVSTLYNFLNKKHLDYNALIPQGLAIEAPEGMYKEGE